MTSLNKEAFKSWLEQPEEKLIVFPVNAEYCYKFFSVVPKGGIEPPTQGFSVLDSSTEYQ